MRTLVLDSSFFPVKIVDWKRAMLLLLTGRAEIVDEYDDLIIRSPEKEHTLPKILRLFSKHQQKYNVKFTRINVYTRDKFTCQYCHTRFQMKDLTFDHVIPQSKGGKTSWENIVTCCRDCNGKKGAKSLNEFGRKLLKTPKRPSWSPVLCLRMKESDPLEWGHWIPGAKTLKIPL